ncbi:MAG: aminodeoxychorismate synthase component I [Candidatus Polarisedimenticolaceae bacterium]|nr:aminodeoxychorismate synthase component I [Candidatus Polarisedimenticolaceae bacterium]
MATPLIHEIPYCEDSAKHFSALYQHPWAFFLDSCQPWSQQGRFDLIAAAPYATLLTQGEQTEICCGDEVTYSTDDPFKLLQQQLGTVIKNSTALPFCGGAMGYFSYDLGRRLERLPTDTEDLDQLPQMAVGLYDWVLLVDHQLRRSWLVSQGRSAATADQWDLLIEQFSQPPAESVSSPFTVEGEARSNMSRAEYKTRFQQIQRYIHEGDCYQVNFAQRFELPVSGDPWSAYLQLRQINPAPFSAYLNLPDHQILSLSPERFLQLQQGHVESKPIKGTAPRGENLEQDQQQAEQLKLSSKDRAENLMIVDLLRNDLSKSCRHVKVPQLFEIESFASVHHLVSTVTGELMADKSATDLLKGSFPGGSITGAPKLRAMEIIEELEPHRRGIYCGSIGYLGFDGNMDSNIAIRTLLHKDGKLSFSAGGGIVADSDPDAEYAETFHKVAVILQMLKNQ